MPKLKVTDPLIYPHCEMLRQAVETVGSEMGAPLITVLENCADKNYEQTCAEHCHRVIINLKNNY